MPLGVTPVLEEEGLRVLLALTVAVPSLSFRPRDQMVLRQIDF